MIRIASFDYAQLPIKDFAQLPIKDYAQLPIKDFAQLPKRLRSATNKIRLTISKSHR